MEYYVYILASRKNGTIYVGVTNNLRRRCEQHASKQPRSFTERYDVQRLVWYETATDARTAIQREKRLKKWNRSWKLRLIEGMNPGWRDLSSEL